MRFHMQSALGLICAVLPLAASRVHAGQLGTFETGLDGWQPNFNDTTVTLNQDTNGATDGTATDGASSLQVVRTAGQWDNTMLLDPLDLTQLSLPHRALAFDATAFPADVPAHWLNLTPVINSKDQSWQQGPDIAITLDAAPHTYIWNYSTLKAIPAVGSGWAQIWLPSNSGQPVTYYLDNIRTLLGGDANADGKVGFTDLVLLAGNYGMQGGATWQQGDFNGDGNVDFTDLVTLASDYGLDETPGGGGATGMAVVPEPASAALVALGALLLPRRRH